MSDPNLDRLVRRVMADPKANPNAQVSPIVELARWASGRPRVGVRYVTPEQAKQKNIPNALVDPRLRGGKIRGPEQFMYLPQSTFQALESLYGDTGVEWPEETQARALGTLLHEAHHLRGGRKWQDEGRAQKRASDLYMQATRRIGIAPDKAKRMFALWLEYEASLPEDYRPRSPRRVLAKNRPSEVSGG